MKSAGLLLLFTLNFHFCFSQDVTISGDHNICVGEVLALVAEGDTSYVWVKENEPDSILSIEYFLHDYPEVNTTYLVYTSTDTIPINVYVSDTDCQCKYFVPNIFTPDGNVSNEEFRPIINCDHIRLHVTIYSQAQEVVYDGHDLEQSWNGTHYLRGTEMEDGVYIYQVSFMKANGEVVRLVGFVLLLR